MFLNPQELLDKKIITYPENINIKDHLQQNGLDVDALTVFNINSKSWNIIGKEKSIKVNSLVHELDHISQLGKEGWMLRKGEAYTFDSSFKINIPEGMCGWVIGRSTFNRQGILIRSSLFDSGFSGSVGATIYCFNNVAIEEGVRVGQFVMCKAENASLYKGQYMHRGL